MLPILLEKTTPPKYTQKFTKHPTTQIHGMMVGFLDCLKCERDISMKAMSSGGKMAFRWNPPLIYERNFVYRYIFNRHFFMAPYPTPVIPCSTFGEILTRPHPHPPPQKKTPAEKSWPPQNHHSPPPCIDNQNPLLGSCMRTKLCMHQACSNNTTLYSRAQLFKVRFT